MSLAVYPPFPLPNIQWFYDSSPTLSIDGKFPSKKRHPKDKVLLFSNASGVKSFEIKANTLIINKGKNFGRVYWEYYELPEYKSTNLGFSTVTAGIFSMTKLGKANYSIKDGNHGTTGYSLDGKTQFGGFGASFHATGIQSKLEGRHGKYNGKNVKFSYPNGKKLKVSENYPYLETMQANQEKNEVVMNIWMIFPDSPNKWLHVAKDRVWAKDTTDWKKCVASMSSKAIDKKDAEKGPAFIKRHHIWSRANYANVNLQAFMIGMLV